jgi:Ca-activated chloride channel homolog
MPRGYAVTISQWAAVMSLFFAAAARADDASRSGAESVKEGNKLLAEYKYADALAAYDKAAERLPDSAPVAYNRGIALYRLGEYDKAEPAFQDALRSANTELEVKAKYNLGRCAHAAALTKTDNLEAAINDLSRAVRFYQDALQLDPKDQDAQKNKELAERLRAFLEKRLEQQKKEQQSSQPCSQPSSQPDQQESTSQPSSQPTSQPQQGDQGEDQKGDQQEQQQGKQEGDKQQDKSSQGKKGDKDKQKGAEKKEGEQEQSSEEGEEGKLKKEEAEPMLQEARDAERQRREAQRERMIRIRGQVPVKQDW